MSEKPYEEILRDRINKNINRIHNNYAKINDLLLLTEDLDRRTNANHMGIEQLETAHYQHTQEIEALRRNESSVKLRLDHIEDMLRRTVKQLKEYVINESVEDFEREKPTFDNVKVLNLNCGKLPYRAIKDADIILNDGNLKSGDIFLWYPGRLHFPSGDRFDVAFPYLMDYLKSINMAEKCYFYVGE